MTWALATMGMTWNQPGMLRTPSKLIVLQRGATRRAGLVQWLLTCRSRRIFRLPTGFAWRRQTSDAGPEAALQQQTR
jgi:hypothetical protein